MPGLEAVVQVEPPTREVDPAREIVRPVVRDQQVVERPQQIASLRLAQGAIPLVELARRRDVRRHLRLEELRARIGLDHQTLPALHRLLFPCPGENIGVQGHEVLLGLQLLL